MAYPSGSTVLRTDIGEEADALHCTTDKISCCNGAGRMRTGEFYFPNSTKVHIKGYKSAYYRNRDPGLIRLNRKFNGHETGQFCCEIPDANGTVVKLYITIGMCDENRYHNNLVNFL